MPPPEPVRRLGRVQPVVPAIGVALAAIPVLVLRAVSDPSPWLHLRVGSFLLAGGRFGLPDPWAPFATRSYIPTQWLPSVVTSFLFDRWGLPVVAWERAAGIGILTAAVVVWLSARVRIEVAVAVTAATMYAAWPGLTERPQLAGLVLLVPVLAAWLRTSEDLRPRWWLVPLTWVAASTHGLWATGTALGAGVVVALVVGRRVTREQAGRLGALVLACLVAAAVTPTGPRLLLTPLTVGAQGRQFVQEWLPSSIRSPHVLVALCMTAAIWLLWVRRQRRPELVELGFLAAAVLLVLSMQRTVPVGALVAAPLLANTVDDALRGGRPTWEGSRSSGAQRVIWVGATLVGVALAVPVAAGRDAAPASVPTGLASALRSLPSGTHVLSDGDLSGWLLFTAPQVKPVFDVRIESYPSPYVQRFIDATHAKPGWSRFVQDTGATAALLPESSALGAGLSQQLRWARVGSDHGVALWEPRQ